MKTYGQLTINEKVTAKGEILKYYESPKGRDKSRSFGIMETVYAFFYPATL